MAEERIEVLRRFWDGFNEDGMPPTEVCDERIEIINPPEFPIRGSFLGYEGVRKWREAGFDVIDELRVEIDELIDAGDGETVVNLLRLRGVGAHTRIPIDETWAAVCTVRGGKLVRAEGFISRREALRVAGLRE